ncbi:MAG: radical SAM protein [Chloroflexota bacterium]|nr:MAG: radical SAM protein [Chloroflexota bacterium]HDD61334.1 radical SAM protein [Chloroflexota bacterium]
MESLRVFGPVPSRRLGRSLGINNIPPKICSYSCVYCQLGRSLSMVNQRGEYYDPEDLGKEVLDAIHSLKENSEIVDYLTIVPDGEPTLDQDLGRLIDILKTSGIKIAVITNSTLLDDPGVRQDLCKADLVSIKVDAVDQNIWKRIDRPYGRIDLENILTGIRIFAGEYNGELITETMLVKDLNDDPENSQKTAAFLAEINPDRSYLSVPTRPPAENWVFPPSSEKLNIAFQIFQGAGLKVEYLIGYEGNEFSFTGNIEQDLLSITSVHPMREDAVEDYLQRAGGDFEIVEKMLSDGSLVASEYQNKRFYLRKLN